ncbi:hypothetical protein [Arthrobacter antioxidans]|uniref:hypothetical protein n=1 Tax=Arthrobacter antioxidans TaxID=2895818 RepID=UPI001FFF3222|nr:hypothetical protein [Arthrobacter antioxidans]
MISPIIKGGFILAAFEYERSDGTDFVFLLDLVKFVLGIRRTAMTKIAPHHLIRPDLYPRADSAAALIEASTAEIEPDTVRKELAWKLALQLANLIPGGGERQLASSQPSDLILLQVICLEHQLPQESTIDEEIETTARVGTQTESIHAGTNTFTYLLRTSS